jgi:hypothetical protein
MKKEIAIFLKIFIGLIIITVVTLFIIGLRLYIINKNKDKNTEKGISLMIPGYVLIISAPFIYLDYKLKLRGPQSSMNVLKIIFR